MASDLLNERILFLTKTHIIKQVMLGCVLILFGVMMGLCISVIGLFISGQIQVHQKGENMEPYPVTYSTDIPTYETNSLEKSLPFTKAVINSENIDQYINRIP